MNVILNDDMSTTKVNVPKVCHQGVFIRAAHVRRKAGSDKLAYFKVTLDPHHMRIHA